MAHEKNIHMIRGHLDKMFDKIEEKGGLTLEESAYLRNMLESCYYMDKMHDAKEYTMRKSGDTGEDPSNPRYDNPGHAEIDMDMFDELRGYYADWMRQKTLGEIAHAKMELDELAGWMTKTVETILSKATPEEKAILMNAIKEGMAPKA